MNDWLKYGIIAVVVLFVWNWLKNGINAQASMNAQMQPSGWGSGMVYAPGSAWTQQAYPYGFPWAVQPLQPSAYAWGGTTPIYANYNPDDGFSFQYGGY